MTFKGGGEIEKKRKITSRGKTNITYTRKTRKNNSERNKNKDRDNGNDERVKFYMHHRIQFILTQQLFVCLLQQITRTIVVATISSSSFTGSI